MEGGGRLKTLLWTLLLCFLSAFVLMVTSICTSSWYTTHPLAPRVQSSFGSLGLIEHCDKSKDMCMERKGILKFTQGFWPYRPLQNRDFDTTLVMLIVVMVCIVSGLVITLLMCFDNCSRKLHLKWLLMFVTLLSAVLGICSILYLDSKVRSEQFRHGWSSYVAWLSVGFLTFVNIPVLYLLVQKPSSEQLMKLDERKDNTYVVQQPLCLKEFQYHDIHNVDD